MATILLVDDNQENLRLLSRVLIMEGYQVIQINRPRDVMPTALEILPDLIILDISMPEMNGYQVCQLVKSDSRTNYIPIIFMSASDDTVDRIRCFEIGGAGFITKPLNIDKITTQIERQLSPGNSKETLYLRKMTNTDNYKT